MKREPLCLIACLLLTGCSAVEHFDKDSPPEYLTVRRAEFFRSGPAQAFPPEKLEKEMALNLLKKDSGYAFVRLLDNRTGYVAFSDLRAAPPVASSVRRDASTSEAFRRTASWSVPLPAAMALSHVPAHGAAASST